MSKKEQIYTNDQLNRQKNQLTLSNTTKILSRINERLIHSENKKPSATNDSKTLFEDLKSNILRKELENKKIINLIRLSTLNYNKSSNNIRDSFSNRETERKKINFNISLESNEESFEYTTQKSKKVVVINETIEKLNKEPKEKYLERIRFLNSLVDLDQNHSSTNINTQNLNKNNLLYCYIKEHKRNNNDNANNNVTKKIISNNTNSLTSFDNNCDLKDRATNTIYANKKISTNQRMASSSTAKTSAAATSAETKKAFNEFHLENIKLKNKRKKKFGNKANETKQSITFISLDEKLLNKKNYAVNKQIERAYATIDDEKYSEISIEPTSTATNTSTNATKTLARNQNNVNILNSNINANDINAFKTTSNLVKNSSNERNNNTKQLTNKNLNVVKTNNETCNYCLVCLYENENIKVKKKQNKQNKKLIEGNYNNNNNLNENNSKDYFSNSTNALAIKSSANKSSSLSESRSSSSSSLLYLYDDISNQEQVRLDNLPLVTKSEESYENANKLKENKLALPNKHIQHDCKISNSNINSSMMIRLNMKVKESNNNNKHSTSTSALNNVTDYLIIRNKLKKVNENNNLKVNSDFTIGENFEFNKKKFHESDDTNNKIVNSIDILSKITNNNEEIKRYFIENAKAEKIGKKLDALKVGGLRLDSPNKNFSTQKLKQKEEAFENNANAATTNSQCAHIRLHDSAAVVSSTTYHSIKSEEPLKNSNLIKITSINRASGRYANELDFIRKCVHDSFEKAAALENNNETILPDLLKKQRQKQEAEASLKEGGENAVKLNYLDVIKIKKKKLFSNFILSKFMQETNNKSSNNNSKDKINANNNNNNNNCNDNKAIKINNNNNILDEQILHRSSSSISANKNLDTEILNNFIFVKNNVFQQKNNINNSGISAQQLQRENSANNLQQQQNTDIMSSNKLVRNFNNIKLSRLKGDNKNFATTGSANSSVMYVNFLSNTNQNSNELSNFVIRNSKNLNKINTDNQNNIAIENPSSATINVQEAQEALDTVEINANVSMQFNNKSNIERRASLKKNNDCQLKSNRSSNENLRISLNESVEVDIRQCDDDPIQIIDTYCEHELTKSKGFYTQSATTTSQLLNEGLITIIQIPDYKKVELSSSNNNTEDIDIISASKQIDFIEKELQVRKLKREVLNQIKKNSENYKIYDNNLMNNQIDLAMPLQINPINPIKGFIDAYKLYERTNKQLNSSICNN